MRLGSKARTHFLRYAPTHWPKGHTRHLEDAVAFCRHLLSEGINDISHAEFNRLSFILCRRRFVVRFVDPVRRVSTFYAQEGDVFEAFVNLEVRTEGVYDWHFSLRHDPDKLEVLEVESLVPTASV